MSDLDHAKSERPPRSENVSEQLALAMTPASSFVGRFLLYVWLSAGAALAAVGVGVVLALAVRSATHGPPGPIFLALILALPIAAIVAVMTAFVRAARRRRREAHALAQHGALIQATCGPVSTVVRHRSRTGASYTSSTTLTFAIDGVEQQVFFSLPRKVLDPSYWVLFHAGNCAAFCDGRATLIRLA